MTTQSANSPAFVLWSVEGEGKQARWTRVGAAWSNKDGKGFNLRCHAIPLAGRLVMRAFSPKRDDDGQDDRQGELADVQ